MANYTLPHTGTEVERALGASLSTYVNAQEEGVKFDWNYDAGTGTPSGQTLNNLIAAASGGGYTIYLGPGYIGIDESLIINGPCEIVGVRGRTWLVPIPSFNGAVIRIENAWRIVGQLNRNSAYTSRKDGVTLRGIGIFGNKALSGSNIVKGVVTYGKCDNLLMEDVDFRFLHQGMSMGNEDYGGQGALIRESWFRKIYFLHCGHGPGSGIDTGTSYSALDIGGSEADTDGNNQLRFDSCSMVYPDGVGVMVYNRDLVDSDRTRRIHFQDLMLHGSSGGTYQSPADLCLIKGNISEIVLDNVRINGSVYSGGTKYAAIHLAKTTDGMNDYYPKTVDICGNMRVNDGDGIVIERGNNIRLQIDYEPSSTCPKATDPTWKGYQQYWLSVLDNAIQSAGGLSVECGRTSEQHSGAYIAPSQREKLHWREYPGDYASKHLARYVSGTAITLSYRDDVVVSAGGTNNHSAPTPVTVTLPPLSEVDAGKVFTIVRESNDGALYTINTNPSDSSALHGGASLTIHLDRRGRFTITALSLYAGADPLLDVLRWVVVQESNQPETQVQRSFYVDPDGNITIESGSTEIVSPKHVWHRLLNQSGVSETISAIKGLSEYQEIFFSRHSSSNADIVFQHGLAFTDLDSVSRTIRVSTGANLTLVNSYQQVRVLRIGNTVSVQVLMP
jgi:hypothetical protein